MPVTNEEIKGAYPHEPGWYENARGAVFFIAGDDEAPKRLFEGAEPSVGGVRHYGEVELLSGVVTHLTWRWSDTVRLPWWLQLLPRWALRLVKHRAPTGLLPKKDGVS